MEQIKSPTFKRSNIGEGRVLKIYSNHSNIIYQSVSTFMKWVGHFADKAFWEILPEKTRMA